MSIATPQTAQATPARSTPLEIASDSLAFGVVFAVALMVIQRGIGFVRGILFCRYMADYELGQWSMVYSFLMLLAPLAVLGLPGCFGRFIEHYLQRGQAGVFIRRIARISCILTLFLASSMYLAPVWYSQIMFRSSDHVAIVNGMAFSIVMVAACNFLTSLMESMRQVRLATLMRFCQGVSFAIVGTLFIAFWSDGATAATIGFGIACICGSLPALWFLWKHQNVFSCEGVNLTHSAMWRRIAPFAVWLWASNLVSNMFEVADRYMLIHWSPVSAEIAHGYVGQYHSGRVIPLLLVGLAIVLEGMFLPYMTVLWEKGKQKEASHQINSTVKLLAIIFTLGAILIIALSPILFDDVLGGKYAGGMAVLPLTLVYCIWSSMFWMWQTYLWVAEKGKLVFAVTGIGLVANIILNAALIPHMELWGAVIATATATLISLILLGFANRMAGSVSDHRIWLLAAFPVVILFPLWLASLSAIAVLVTTWKTTWVLNEQEKGIAVEYAQSLKAKVLGRFKK